MDNCTSVDELVRMMNGFDLVNATGQEKINQTYGTSNTMVGCLPGQSSWVANHGQTHRPQLDRCSSTMSCDEISRLVGSQSSLANCLLRPTPLGHRGLTRSSSDPLPSARQSFLTSTETQSIDGKSEVCRYKTELCRPFEENGVCKYGNKCQFAHGKHELRTPMRHPKYKTDLCKTYHTTGLCPYGSRCHFIHDDNDDTVAARENRRLIEEEKVRVLQQEMIKRQQLQQIQQQEQLLKVIAQFSVANELSKQLANTQNFLCHDGMQHPCESLSSLATNSSPSSVSESPVSSPTSRMFNSGDNLQTGFLHDAFSWPESRQSSLVSPDGFCGSGNSGLFSDVKSASLKFGSGPTSVGSDEYTSNSGLDLLAIAQVLSQVGSTCTRDQPAHNRFNNFGTTLPSAFGLTL